MIPTLSRREKVLMAGAVAIVTIAAGWAFLWQPLQVARAEARAEIVEARTLLRALALHPESGAPPRAVSVPEGAPAARVTRAAEAEGIALARVEPRGSGVSVMVDEAAFEDVLSWIARMERDEALRLSAVEFNRRPAPGIVSARLDLESLQ